MATPSSQNRRRANVSGIKTRQHPIFDPTSLYGRMRNSVWAEDKMLGYFCWQKARATRLGLPLPVQSPQGEAQRQRELRGLSAQLADGSIEVQDATERVPVRLSRGGAWEPGRAWGARVCLVCEADESRSVGLLVEGDVLPPCRAFLIEPEGLQRLQE